MKTYTHSWYKSIFLQYAFISSFLFVVSLPAVSQPGSYVISRSFTVADGLPSNHVYTCVEDDHGFLWVATDAGIARFDGKNFQVFTTQQGLPDDEVLSVVKENNGRIWVNCFKQSPAYFDEAGNRFVNAREDSCLAKVRGTNLIYLSALPGGGVMYNNEKGSYIFENNKLRFFAAIPQQHYSNVTVEWLNDGSFVSLVNNSDAKTYDLVTVRDDKLTDSIRLLHYRGLMQLRYFLGDNKVYLQKENSKGYYIISNIHSNPLSYTMDSLDIGEDVSWLGAGPSAIYVISKKGESLIFDKQSKELAMRISENYSANSMYRDKQGNIWISSIDKGLFLYKKKIINIVRMPHGFTNTYFLSIARTPGGAILAGNYFGEVIEAGTGYFNIHKLPEAAQPTAWQRKIILSQNKIFTFSEGGSYCNYAEPLINQLKFPMASKTAAVLNDSALVEGSYGKLRVINTKTNELNILGGLSKRATCIYAAPGSMIYHGSTDGLYKFDLLKNTDIDLTASHPLLSERITALASTADGMVWVGTASSGLLQLRNDSVLRVFSTGCGMASNNIKCITGGRPGELWVGTNTGICIIRYQNDTGHPVCENITVCDGLSSNIINEMLFSDDSVFCATANGISVLPAGISLPAFDIPVRLTRVQVNNNDTAIASAYRLRYDENYLQLHFAGIEPGGHFAFFQYQVDKGGWSRLEGNTLDLQLSSGDHTVSVRAVDLNMKFGSQPLVLKFHIGIPFWKSLWVWLGILAVCIALSVWFFRKREFAKREVALQGMLNQKKMAELELQALKSQIDPHFIFNCLNSIKLLNHKQQYSIAESYLDRFAALLRSALEQSSVQLISLQEEIDFIGNYLALEKLRFPNRLFYQVECDPALDLAAITIPSMLLQPYIENSIRHGIVPLKDRPGFITIRFKKEETMLQVEVEDNGTGINAGEMKSSRKGIGIMNTQRRCLLYDIRFSISNLNNASLQLCGTVVRLSIPLHDHKPRTLFT